MMSGAPRQRAKSRATMQGGSYELSFFLSKVVSEGSKNCGRGSGARGTGIGAFLSIIGIASNGPRNTSQNNKNLELRIRS